MGLMDKHSVTRLWLWGLALIVGGIVLVLAFVGVMLAAAGTWNGGVYTPSYNALFFAMVALIAVAGVAILAGMIAQFVAWIGAMVNTARSSDKTWFVLLLVLGLLGFGFIIMIVYLIAGPDVRPAPPAIGWPAPPPLPPPLVRSA